MQSSYDIFRSLEPLLDLLLLPLSFHVVLLLLAAAAPLALARLLGSAGLLIVLAHLSVAIAIAGGDWRDATALLAWPFYTLWKLLQIPLLIRSSAANAPWVRTERRRRLR